MRKTGFLSDYTNKGESSSERPLDFFKGSPLCLRDPNGDKYYGKSTYKRIYGECSCQKQCFLLVNKILSKPTF